MGGTRVDCVSVFRARARGQDQGSVLIFGFSTFISYYINHHVYRRTSFAPRQGVLPRKKKKMSNTGAMSQMTKHARAKRPRAEGKVVYLLEREKRVCQC